MARRGSSTARRYAEAAFQIAERDKNTAEWLAELDRLAVAVADGEVVRHLENPQIPFDTRHEAFNALFRARAMVPQVYNLIGLLLRRRRLEA
ncbi:MAG TPA: F0F1 ATP synthase subunit delta, partial [Candidatus Limnocylindrales bacterium]